MTGLCYLSIDSVPFHVRTLVSPAAILSRDSTTRRYSRISDLVGSPSDLRISSVTFGLSTFDFGHRIYFGSSLDLSDSSLILEIGPSSEILWISRPSATLLPSFPLTLRLPLPGSLEGFPPLAISLTRAPYLQRSSYLGFGL